MLVRHNLMGVYSHWKTLTIKKSNYKINKIIEWSKRSGDNEGN